MGSKKGQLFILGVIFLVGLIFIVQQALLGYTSLDISEPPEKGESYLTENILKTIRMAISENDDCSVFGERMEEVRNIIEMGRVSGAHSVSLDYVIDCTNWDVPEANVMNVTIITTGQDSESHGFFEFHSPGPVILGIEDHSGVPDTTVDVPVYMENRDYEVSGVEFNLEFDPSILELQDIEGIGRANGFNVMEDETEPGRYHVISFKTGTVIPWGSEDLINLRFRVNPYASIGSVSGLEVSSVNLGDRLGGEITRKGDRDGKFTVVEAPEITVTYPNGGESFEKGYSYGIAWEREGNVQKVDIDLYKSGEYQKTLFPDTANDGSEYWTPTNTDVPQDGTDYKIRINGRGTETDVQDMSDGNFEIFTPLPVLEVVPGSMTFNAHEGNSRIADKFFSISNAGTGMISWTIETDDDGLGWLSVSPENGIGDDTVSVSAGNTILSEGSYTGTVTITASNPVSPVQGSPFVLDVGLDVTQRPVLGVSETLLTFTAEEGGSSPDPLTFGISNSGGGTLKWHATKTEDWLDLFPASGTGDGTVYVSVDITGMTETGSPYTGTVSVSDPDAGQSPQTVDVEVFMTTLPVISPSPSTLTFTAAESGGRPASKTLTISNSGSGSLSWTAAEIENLGEGWLSISPVSGGDGDTISVSCDISGLTPGTYAGTVTVTDPGAENSPVDVPVSLTLNPDMSPLIEVTEPTGSDTWTMGNPHEIRWTSRSVSDKVTIGLYRGTQFQRYIAQDDENTGDFTWTVPATLSDGTNYKVRVMDYETGALDDSEEFGINGEAVINVVPDSLSFTATNGPDPEVQTITVENTGTGTLPWEAAESIPWLTVTPSSRSDEGLADVSVNINGLPDGTYSGTVTIREQGNPSDSFSLPVTLTVSPEPPGLTITNPNGGESYTGGDTMHITWEEVNGGANVRLDLYRNDAYSMEIASSIPNDGTHSWGIPSGIGGDAYYKVRIAGIGNGAYDYSDDYFTINSLPAITADPASLTYTVVSGDQDPKVRYITVSNTGGGSFDWNAADENDFDFDPSSGSLSPGQSDVIASTFYPFTQAGSYSRSCVISAPGALNDPATVDILINVLLPPTLEVSPSSLSFSMDEGASSPVQSRSFSISNSGGGTLQWSVQTASSGWLSADSYSGSGDSTVKALADVQGLGTGTYQGQITVTGTNPNVQGSPKTIDVTLTVNPVYPVINADPSSLSFSANENDPNPPNKAITITNTGGGTLEWTAAESGNYGGDWLSISPVSGGDGDVITVSVDNSGLSPGTYTGTVTITDPGAENSPVTVDVSHKVNDVNRYITITGPDQPDTIWYRFYLYHIAWDERNSGDDVKIVLYKDSGSTFVGEIASSTPNDGYAGWEIPVDIPEGDHYRVGVGSLDYPVSDISDYDIKIRHPIKVEYPNTPLIWRKGETREITWSGRTGIPPDNPVIIDLYKGGTFEKSFGKTDNDLSQTYEVPNVPGGDDYTIKISDSGNRWEIYDYSDSEFSIYDMPVLSVSPGSLNFVTDEGTNPGGKNFVISNSGGGTLSWNTVDDMNWARLLPTSGTGDRSVLVMIDSSGLGPGTYSGTITVSCIGGCAGSPKTVGVSLTVNGVSNPSFTVTAPNGGETWENGETRELEWTSTDVEGNVRLSINTDDGQVTKGITSNTENDGLFSWLVCADTQAANDYRLRVSMRDDETVFDESDGTFFIGKPLYEITSPAGGEILSGGQTYDITWKSDLPAGYDGRIQIYLYKGGEMYDTITHMTMTSYGSYSWTVQNGLDGSDFSVHAREYYCGYISDESSQFTITSTPIGEPVLSVSPSSLSFSAPAYQGSSETQNLSIQNTGQGTLEWTASDDRNWLILDNYSGTGDSTIRVDTLYDHGLAPGTYTGTVTLSCTDCQGSPKNIPVSFEVMPGDNFEIADTSASGKYVSVPLNLMNSINIDEFDLDIEYDHRVLERLHGVTKMSRLSSMDIGTTTGTGTGSILTGTVNPNNYIRSGSGKIADIVFMVNSSADVGDTSPVTIKRLYNVGNPDGIPVYPSDFDLYDGVFTLADSTYKILIPDDVPASAGGTVTVPVRLDNPGATPDMIQVFVYFNPDIVDCEDELEIEKTSRTQSMTLVGGNCQSDASGSYIFFALYQGNLYPGSGDIVRITFPISSSPQGSETALEIEEYHIYSVDYDLSYLFSVFDGSIKLF